jgi:hypothetical protein
VQLSSLPSVLGKVCKPQFWLRQISCLLQCWRDCVAAGTNWRGPAVRIGESRNPIIMHVFLLFSESHYYLSIIQINLFRPSPRHCQWQSFRFSVKTFRGAANIIHRGPNLLPADLTYCLTALYWSYCKLALVPCYFFYFISPPKI